MTNKKEYHLTELQKKKKTILDKYFPNKGVSDCDFDIDTGRCKKCGIFFADKTIRLCAVISVDEVSLDDDNLWKD